MVRIEILVASGRQRTHFLICEIEGAHPREVEFLHPFLHSSLPLWVLLPLDISMPAFQLFAQPKTLRVQIIVHFFRIPQRELGVHDPLRMLSTYLVPFVGIRWRDHFCNYFILFIVVR